MQLRQLPNLFQREAKVLALPDEAHCLQIMLGVFTITTRSTRWRT
jgi:hypothetical protein